MSVSYFAVPPLRPRSLQSTVSTTGSRSPLSRPEPARASHPVRLRDRHAASKSQFWSSEVAVSQSASPRCFQRACSPPINELERPGQERLQISLQGVYTRYKPGAVYSVLLLDSSMPLVLTSCVSSCASA